MLQQTRVAAVLEHYRTFLESFPTVVALALAPEDRVLALWSGLGYYRRARMLHRAAKFLLQQHGGTLPHTAAELRKLPGVGAYTSAAIASIAFGEVIAVVDGNVERVLLRIAGQAETPGRVAEQFVSDFAQALVDPDAPGDHNQAMMELGATVCLPRAPLCLQCPVFDLCRTRGEHVTQPRAAMRSERVAYAVTTRKPRGGSGLEVLLHRRAADLSLMPDMVELPPLQAPPEGSPMLRLRHAIVGTNYYVEIFAVPQRREVQRRMRPAPSASGDGGGTKIDPKSLRWSPVSQLHRLPLTGLARKVLQRTALMLADVTHPKAGTANGASHAAGRAGEDDAMQEVPLLIGRHTRATDGSDED